MPWRNSQSEKDYDDRLNEIAKEDALVDEILRRMKEARCLARGHLSELSHYQSLDVMLALELALTRKELETLMKTYALQSTIADEDLIETLDRDLRGYTDALSFDSVSLSNIRKAQSNGTRVSNPTNDTRLA